MSSIASHARTWSAEIKYQTEELINTFQDWDVHTLSPLVATTKAIILKFLRQFGNDRLYYTNILGFALQRGDAVCAHC